MSAFLKQIQLGEDESFFIGVFQDNLEKSIWHYHNHYEISFITEGSGKRIVADNIDEFQPGDMVFLGRDLPHAWIADKDQGIWSSRSLEMVNVQFTSEIFNQQMLKLPEFRHVEKALTASDQGIRITGDTLNDVSELMLQMPYLKGFQRMIHLLRIMDLIGRSGSLIPLASKEYMKTRFITENKRIRAIHEYLMNNYKSKVDLTYIAQMVNMAEGSLCRYFKQNMGMTIFEYLNKIKIEFARRLLMDPDLTITDVCWDSGYNNLSHFNKQFKKIIGMTPNEYRKKVSVFR